MPSMLELVCAAASQPAVWLWGMLGGALDAQSNVLFGLLGYTLLTDGERWPAQRAAIAMSLVSVPVGLACFAGSAACARVRTPRARCALILSLIHI